MRGVRLRTWLLRVAANRAVDWLRKHAAQTEVALVNGLAAPQGEGPAAGMYATLAALVEAVCGSLPEEQQQILWWYAYRVPHATIARWVGKSDAAVRQVVARAKRTMRVRVLKRIAALPAHDRQALEGCLLGLLSGGGADPGGGRGGV